mmetsp:Transcript_798/g.1276  ORF Transcript_798/g.1276 Transcript_798/m.1276 type:complete len:117 (+) Transcript_798:617-967(+)
MTGLMLIAVGFVTDELPIADGDEIPAPPTAEATATSTFGADGCGINTPSTGGGGIAKLGGAPDGGIANDGRPGGRPGGSGAAPGGSMGGGGGGIGAKTTAGSSVKQSSVSGKSLYP